MYLDVSSIDEQKKMCGDCCCPFVNLSEFVILTIWCRICKVSSRKAATDVMLSPNLSMRLLEERLSSDNTC